ncbi:hypothetical protein PSDVSF_22400 [Pseudodesulfovibrio sediminis]|uniref:Uncharacterized protein n=1 Tax=Pseudodesulfovibrio sediminis TaxID=2810563 RepID=A0ABM7P7N2_9BACT|nr:hypothetical protein PSDVSF_22400 [Pseudodesulfovibrio sediminis]
MILHSEALPTQWTHNIESGLSNTLGNETSIRQEFLGGDTLDEDHFEEVFEQLAQKPPSSPLAVVANGETAFAFARKFGEDLFPGVPVIFCSMDWPDPTVLNQCGPCTGVPLKQDIAANLELIFTLKPDTRLVVVISDDQRRTLRATTDSAMKPYMDRAQILFPGYEPGDNAGLSLAIMGDVLASVPEAGVVLFLGYTEDGQGNMVENQQIVSLIERRSVSPVFLITDTLLGSGAVGGVVVSGTAVGRKVADIILDIRSGQAVNEMLPEPVPTEVVLDGTALARFGMTAIPGACVVNAPEQAPDEQGLSASWIALAALAFLGCLLLAGRRYMK